MARANLLNSGGETSRLQCAGLNRHEAEEEEASRERTSDPLGPEFCVGYREIHDEAGNRWGGY